MKVSIIVPIYNGERYLEECLTSILNQSFLDYELILINDGSIDNTHSICTKFADLDERIKYLNTDNNGVSIARNLGIEKSNGEYIWFVDADDLISPDFLNDIFVNRKLDFDILQFDFLDFDQHAPKADKNKSKGIKKYENLISFLEKDTYTRSLWRNIFKRKVIVDNEIIFIPNLKFGEDLLFTLQSIISSSTIFKYNSVGYYYRQHADSVMKKDRTISDALHHITILQSLVSIYNKLEDVIVKQQIIKEIKSISTTYIAFSALSKKKISPIDLQIAFNEFYDNNIAKGNIFLKKIGRLKFYRVSIMPVFLYYRLK